MRSLFDHVLPGTTDNLGITATDEPGAGGAHHEYVILSQGVDGKPVPLGEINFQNGPIKEAGVNGVTEDSLMTVLLDRFRAFQEGPYKSRYNALVITKLEEALHWNQQRTIERLRKGVEGTSAK